MQIQDGLGAIMQTAPLCVGHCTDFGFVLKQSEKCNYNRNLVCINQIKDRFLLCVAWKFFRWFLERITPLGIMGTEFRAPLNHSVQQYYAVRGVSGPFKPLSTTLLWCSRCFRAPLNLSVQHYCGF